jgi:hypothetical protein
MTQRRLAFVQPNFQQGPQDLHAYYLPYSAGVILARAWQDVEIKKTWRQGDLVWRRDPIEATAQVLSQHDMVAFSTYVWNHRYNYALAQRIKQINPDCVTVFGGPEPAITDPDLFRREPFMDVVIKMEGEITFSQLLKRPREKWIEIPGLLINHDGTVIDTGNSERILDLADLPSPYLAGMFDDLVKKHPDIIWNATLETNRGCPYQCTFCDWGSLTYNKVKQFGLERVYAELDWIGEHCGFVTIADANFGMFVERDNLIIDKLIEVQKRWGKVTSFSMTWAKNQKNEVVDMVKKLIDHSPSFGQGLTVSVQSMDNTVLENIKRRNLDQHKIDQIFDLCDRRNIPVYTEVILGLPGETVASWRETFWRIFRAGNHTGINILQAQLLENAEMNLMQKKLWKLESVPIYDYMSGSYGDMDLSESVDVVIATREIDREAMLDTLVWNTFIQTFHINGLTTYIARFIRQYRNIDYAEFYEGLERRVYTQDWLREQFDLTRHYFQNWTVKGRADHPAIADVQIFGWNLVHRVTLLMQQQYRVASVQDWIADFVQQEFDLDTRLATQLLDFQRNYVINHADMQNLPKIRTYDYDFLGFIQDGSDLERPCTLSFDSIEDKNMSLTKFLEGMYFYRKRNFGKTMINRINMAETIMLDCA